MTSEWCKKCGKFAIWPESHKCPPLWELNEPEYDEDHWEQIYAIDEETAAEEWADKTDAEGDYSIVDGSPAIVLIRKYGETETKKFEVTGETVPEYRANEINDK